MTNANTVESLCRPPCALTPSAFVRNLYQSITHDPRAHSTPRENDSPLTPRLEELPQRIEDVVPPIDLGRDDPRAILVRQTPRECLSQHVQEAPAPVRASNLAITEKIALWQ